MAEWGIRKGLAVDLGFGQQTADIARRGAEQRQAMQLAEQRTTQEAADMEYLTPMNAWDNENVKKYAESTLKEMGSFMRDNPDWKYNIDKRRVYNQYKRSLIDNPYLNEGKTVDQQEKLMRAYMADPKNAPLLDTPEFKQQLANYDTYIKTGSIDGNTANRKLFTFTPPEEHMDTTPDLMKYANAANYDQEKTVYLSGSTGAKKRWISDARKIDVAKAALGDAKLGRELRWEYNKYLSELGDGAQPITLEQYAVTKLNPYFKQQEYDKFGIPTKSSDSSSGQSTKGRMDLFGNLVATAQANPNTPVTAIGKGAKNVFTKGQTSFSLAGSGFMKDDGELIPFKNIGIPSDKLDVSNSFLYYNTDKKMPFLVADVVVPVDQAKSILEEGDPINDPWTNIFWPTSKETYTPQEGYKGMTPFLGEDGEQYVKIRVSKPVQGGNTQVNAEYDFGAGQGMSGFSETNEQSTGNSPQVGQETTLPSGKKAVFNGVKWVTK